MAITMQTKPEIEMTDELYQLSPAQAQEVLAAFLKTEREEFPKLAIGAIELDYSLQSVADALKHITTEVEAGHLDEEQRNVWFMRLGYYFGEALRQSNSGLSWGLGNPEYAFANHPVIVGFAGSEEAPMITICKNLVDAVAEGISPISRISNAVNSWFGTAVETSELRELR